MNGLIRRSLAVQIIYFMGYVKLNVRYTVLKLEYAVVYDGYLMLNL